MSSFAPILSDMILLSRLQSNLLVTVIWPASLLFVLYFLEEKKVLKSVASFARYFGFLFQLKLNWILDLERLQSRLRVLVVIV